MADLNKMLKTLKMTGVVSLAVLGLACTGTLEPTGGGNGDGDGDVDAAPASAERTQFENNVRPLLVATRDKGTCAGCHAGAAVPTLFGDNALLDGAYDALLAGNDLTDPAANSQLIGRGDHDGNAFCVGAGDPDAYCTQDEITIITDWISAEIAAGTVNAP